MSADWAIVRLGNYCSKIGSGSTPTGGSSVYLDQGEICLIRSQNIYNKGFKPNGLAFITEDAANKLKNVIVEKNDVLLNITGDSVARVCLAKEEFLPARVNQHVAIIRPDPNEFDPRYLRYFLASPTMQSFLLSIAAVGATRNALTKSMIESLEVSKPPITIQTAISDQLEVLDKKIHLNTQTNQTLEQIAQAIFKSWFVDFDPVKAKIAVFNSLSLGERAGVRAQERAELAAMSIISGKDEAQLAQLQIQDAAAYQQLAQTAALFPSAMQESELGDIPKGWELKKMGDYLETISKTYPLKSASEVIFLNTGDIQNGKFLHSDASNSDVLPGQAKKSIQKNDILYSEIRPENKRFAYVYFDAERYVVSTKLMVLRATKNIDPLFLYFILTQQSIIDHLQMLAESRSGTFPQITFGAISGLEFIGSKDNLIAERFVKLVLDPFFNNQQALGRQNESLTCIRDSLLPKLLSGEITIPDIEDRPAD